MTLIEQHKIIEQLKSVCAQMNTHEQGEFEMLVKRDRDDEEFDSIARAKMEKLQLKYIPKRSKQELENLWKKFQSGSKE